MKHICIVTSGELPVPDVLGGAIEHLVSQIIDDNEEYHLMEFIVVTSSHFKARRLQNKYKYTKFVNINSDNFFFQKFIWKVCGLLRMLGIKHTYWLHSYERKMVKYLMKNGSRFDLIINEGAQLDTFYKVSRKYGKKKICMHLHMNCLSSEYFEETYGHVMCVSDFIRNEFLESSKINAEEVITVFNGIETSNFFKVMHDKAKADLRRELGIGDMDFVILYCGRIVPEKGIKELIYAFLNVCTDDMKLLIVGSSNFGLGDKGRYPFEVKKLVENHSDKIKITGYVQYDDLYKYHNISDIGVVPSTYNDPCPLALFEMIASSLPTIVTSAGGMTQIANRFTSIFIRLDNIVDDLGKAIEKLYKEPETRFLMSIKAKERSVYFDRKRFYNDFINVINIFSY
jgi:spore coat protein SA